MSFAKPYLDYQYTYERGWWCFHHGDEVTKSKDIGIIYDRQDAHLKAFYQYPDIDMLLKHGDWNLVSNQFKERCEVVKGLMELRLVWVPPEEIEALNNAISISASDWCRKLEAKVDERVGDCLVILEENNSGDDTQF